MDTNSLSIETLRGPKYRRLYDALDRAIRSGMLKPGAKLPPVRELAWQLKITPGTVARAYQLATDDGLLEATVGRGTFVRSAERALADMPVNEMALPITDGNALNLRNGQTVDVGQSEVIARIGQDVLASGDVDFTQYAREQDLIACRDQAAAWLEDHGVAARKDDLVITHGAHSAMMVALNAILHGKEPVVATTNLVYPGFRQSARISRAQLMGVGSDENGIMPDALEAMCRRHRPQALLISSNVHNPTCTFTSLERRQEIARLAQKFDFQIIEDDVYGTLIPTREIGFDRLCPERAWHATSMSKCMAAGLRIGFLQCPPGQGELGVRVMQGMSLSISHFLAALVEQLFAHGHVADFGRRIAAENTARVEVARSVLSDWNVRSQNGVPLIWLRKPDRWTSGAFMSACQNAGVLIAPSDSFALPGQAAPNAVRLSLSAASDYPTLRRGLETVNSLLGNRPRGMLT